MCALNQLHPLCGCRSDDYRPLQWQTSMRHLEQSRQRNEARSLTGVWILYLGPIKPEGVRLGEQPQCEFNGTLHDSNQVSNPSRIVETLFGPRRKHTSEAPSNLEIRWIHLTLRNLRLAGQVGAEVGSQHLPTRERQSDV